MDNGYKQGYCLHVVKNGNITQKINGFETMEEAKSFLKFEFFELFEKDYSEDFSLFKEFCTNSELSCWFAKSDFGFIYIRPSVWEVEKSKIKEYDGLISF